MFLDIVKLNTITTTEDSKLLVYICRNANRISPHGHNFQSVRTAFHPKLLQNTPHRSSVCVYVQPEMTGIFASLLCFPSLWSYMYSSTPDHSQE